MVGIDPNNIIPRWFRAARSEAEMESVLIDARREHAGSMQHAIQDKVQSLEAQLADEKLEADFRPILVEKLRAVRDLSRRLGFTP